MVLTSFDVYFVWLCMIYVHMSQKCYLAYFGEDRLATLL